MTRWSSESEKCMITLIEVFASLAFSGGADASQLVPLYNTNTLVAVVLGSLVLGERVTSMMAVGGFLLLVGVGAVIQSQRAPAPVQLPKPAAG